MTTTATFDAAALTTALETRDAEAQLAVYTSDAELTIVDRDNPPSRPRSIKGTDALRDYILDFTSREMTHKVRATVVSADRIAFELACQYPDGTRVLCMCIAGVVDGRIAWQHQVQAWDA